MFYVEDRRLHCKGSELIKYGKHNSPYDDVFTDHAIVINRYRCQKCHYESTYTIKKVLGHSLSGNFKVQEILKS